MTKTQLVLFKLAKLSKEHLATMEKQVRGYYKYKNDIIFLLAVSGLWPDYKKYPKSVKYSLTVLSVFAEFATAFGIVNFCLHNLTSINVLTRGLGLMISFSSACLKVLILTYHRSNLIKLNCTLSYQFEKDLESPESRRHLLAHYPSFHRYFRLHYYYTAVMVVLMVTSPLFALRHGNYIRAYPQLIPFAYDTGGLLHWAIYGFELIEGWYCWSNTVGVDSLFGLYALHMVGQLRLLSHRFQNLKSGHNYEKDLKECIDRHVFLIESKYVMQRVFGFLSVWLAITCAIVLCAIIFQSSQIRSMTLYKVIYLVVYCTIKSNQAYTYAWFGHMINVESENCIHAIYYGDWVDRRDLQLTRDAIVILSQNSMYFKAMGIMIVRLDMFLKIMSTSVSYFFLLKALDQKLKVN